MFHWVQGFHNTSRLSSSFSKPTLQPTVDEITTIWFYYPYTGNSWNPVRVHGVSTLPLFVCSFWFIAYTRVTLVYPESGWYKTLGLQLQRVCGLIIDYHQFYLRFVTVLNKTGAFCVDEHLFVYFIVRILTDSEYLGGKMLEYSA